jgi:hypothetical protein
MMYPHDSARPISWEGINGRCRPMPGKRAENPPILLFRARLRRKLSAAGFGLLKSAGQSA